MTFSAYLPRPRGSSIAGWLRLLLRGAPAAALCVLLTTCTGGPYPSPPAGFSKSDLLVQDCESTSIDLNLSSIPRTPRFVFLATGETTLYYVDRDGYTYMAFYGRQQPGFGTIPPTARFAFLSTGQKELLYVAGNGYIYDAKSRNRRLHDARVPPSAYFAFAGTGKYTLYYIDQDGFAYLAKDGSRQPDFGSVPSSARFAFASTGIDAVYALSPGN
jgi:hypothetical protein